MKALSDKHQAFCDEYLQCWSAAKAYKRVYPTAKQNTCWSNGSELLRKTEVRAHIESRLKAKQMSADEVLSRLSDQAKASLEPFMVIGKDGLASFDFSSDEARSQLHIIKRIKSRRTRRLDGKGKNAEQWEDEQVDVEIVDAQSALTTLGKHHKLFSDKLEVVHSLDVIGMDRMLDQVYGEGDDQG
jgi:phage terminase small subunit